MKHISIHVKGKVQGVFFRASTRDVAQNLGLLGFVRNEPDGSVYIEAEGPDPNLDLFIAWCKKGPDRARVDEVSVSEGSVAGFRGFEVRR